MASSKKMAPLRRRLKQVRTAFAQLTLCLPLSGSSSRTARLLKKRQIDDEKVIESSPDDNDKGRTCVIPIPPTTATDTVGSEAAECDAGKVNEFPNSSEPSGEESSKQLVARNSVTAATIVEPLKPSPRSSSYLTSRVNRTFLLRKTKAALNKVKHSSDFASVPNKKPVSSSTSRPRCSRRPLSQPKASASSTPRPQFHGGKASLSGCLMTFVIFTNGSSTRMWFLVSRQQENDQSEKAKPRRRPAPERRRRPSDRPASASSSLSSNSSRQRTPSSPPVSPPASGCCDKKRSPINRFLYEEDRKCMGVDARSRLAIAASWACPAAVKLLLRRGAPVNSVDARGKAALHYVAYGHSSVQSVVECLLLLLDAGAQVNCFDDEHNTPLHLAALAGCGPAMGLLLRRGADSSVPNYSGRTPVFNFLNNAFNAENIPGLLELACGSPYAFAGAFHFSDKASMSPAASLQHTISASSLFDSSPSSKLVDCTGRMPLVLKLTLQPSLLPVHVDESLALSSQFKELLCLFATCPPSLQLLATHSIRSAVLEALHVSQKSESSPSTDCLQAAAQDIDLPNSLKSCLFA